MLPPIPRDSTNRAPSPLHSLAPTGDVGAFENLGNNKLGVRFEINIVKVSFLPSVLRKRLLMLYILLYKGAVASPERHPVPQGKR